MKSRISMLCTKDRFINNSLFVQGVLCGATPMNVSNVICPPPPPSFLVNAAQPALK
ncbi:uncharacterized protein EI90DRAFT_3072647 [Cantharellus anzutake]|uniref:uncharacterized protein n=1 Tax=Cantharellus anzutake TaxID=1750568 RepID=UPI001905A853|nr:uncharacterized protein EI90DRAFT_3072647 [Cantharellus anzutake]KAF8325379.1 hypothetical protein EI90DRAFT_3072647 [Cantharellus anzutake]